MHSGGKSGFQSTRRSCQVPLAAYATIDDGQMFLRALVGNHMTGEYVTAEYTGLANEPEENARKVWIS